MQRVYPHVIRPPKLHTRNLISDIETTYKLVLIHIYLKVDSEMNHTSLKEKIQLALMIILMEFFLCWLTEEFVFVDDVTVIESWMHSELRRN